jgi:RecB family exonuclease
VASRRYWRELYVAAAVGEVAIEGYIDLLYETDAGLVIVDYKTDTIGPDAATADKVDRYARQLAGYAIALETATGLTVAAATLLFCTKNGPVESAVPDLDAVRAAVAVQVTAASAMKRNEAEGGVVPTGR